VCGWLPIVCGWLPTVCDCPTTFCLRFDYWFCVLS